MADDSVLALVDHFMVLEKDDMAFFSGARVDLKCTSSNGLDTVTAVTSSKSVPHAEFTCCFPSWCGQFVKPGDSFTVVNFKVDERDGKTIMTSKDREPLLPILHVQDDWKNVAEGFAGIGGWSHGANLVGKKPVLLVEHDDQTAYACAYTWQIPVMFPSEVIMSIEKGELPSHFVLIADVNSVICQVIGSIMKVGTWLWSPPCQPWSKAGRMSGIQSPEGVAFVHAIMGLRLSKPQCINIENVPGLAEHKDFQHLKHVFDQVGYRIACSSIDKVHPLLPIIRNRWLCTVLPKDFDIAPGKTVLAFKTVIPSEVPGIGKETSIGAAGCVQSIIRPWELEHAIPSKETLELLSRYDLLPPNVRKLHPGAMTPDQVLKARTKSLRHCLPNVMAMQGSQHTLPIQHLQEKGLHAFLIDDGTNQRFALPFEIATAMGFQGNTTLPSDFVSAWRITGNALSVPHAALQCFRSHILMGERSPFSCSFKGCFDLCKAFRSQQILLDDFDVKQDKEWMVLADWAAGTDEQSFRAPKTDLVEGSPKIPKAKRQQVSPTWEYHDQDQAEVFQAVPIPGEMVESFALNASRPAQGDLISDDAMPMPEEEWVTRLCDSVENEPNRSITKIIHEQGFWAHFVWIDGNGTIGEIIQQCLPHAAESHFVKIRADGVDIRFGTKAPQTRWKQIHIEPRSITRIVQTSVHSKVIPVILDVTWKFKDLVAYIAAETAVLAHNMSVYNEMSQLMKHEGFVLGDSSTRFSMSIAPGYTDHVTTSEQYVGEKHIQVPTIATALDSVSSSDHQMTPFVKQDEFARDEGKIRLVVRCPKWGSIRTAVFDAESEVGNTIPVLFPHFHPDNQPCIVWNEVKVEPSTKLKHLIDRPEVEVFFPGDKLWPVTALVLMRVGKPFEFSVDEQDVIQTKQHIALDIKGPFDFRAQKKTYPQGSSVLHVAASFMGDYTRATTLFVTQNGKGIDPRMHVENVNLESPLHVRACALPGGAKKKSNDVHEVLGKMLVLRGVPEAEKASRINAIESKIPTQDLKLIVQKEDQAAWEELKKHANQNKIRLITHQELHDHQKAVRASKGKGKPEADGTIRTAKPKPAPMEPKQVTIDVSLFHAAGSKVSTCDIGKFGPDMTGVAIVMPDQAEKFLPISRLSADPLALLVLSPKAIAGVDPVQIPAQDGKGNPILTYVVLLNFGDVAIELEHSLPSTTITEIPMTILEIVIQRTKVNKWEDVQNPLNYLGLHLPEIRTGQVVSTWNLRSYGEDRQKCKHTDATYVHGFVKIPTAGVDITLGRSGMAGIFIQAKGDNKKPDPAYGIVTMYGQTLEEVLKVASKTKDTLGVVQVSNGQYAIRGRREKLADIRKKVMPQSIAVQEGCIEPNSQWWHLRNIHMSTTCDSLTKALEDLGWKASAIRPINKSTWLVAATDEPPAAHVCINNQFVAVVPVTQKTKQASVKVETKVVPLALQGNFAMSPDDADMESTAPSTTRLAEMRMELETTVNSMIEQKMKACDGRINGLQQAIEESNTTWKHQHEETKQAVQDVQAQVVGVETSITAANTNMLSQMQSMFSKMQANLTAQLDHMKENKRQKVES